MNDVTEYAVLIKDHLSNVAELVSRQYPAESGVETECVFDDERGVFLLTRVGWWNGSRVRGATLHVRLKDGKIWIEEDMTEEGLANVLMDAGVPAEDIVLAFQAPEMRKHTEFAAV